jgi:peptidoglycan hydrolase CwlO-like protein
MMQKILLGVIAVAAVTGWIVAFLSTRDSSELEDRIAAAKIELTKASEQLTDTQSRLALTQGAASGLEDIDKRVAAKRTEAVALAEEMAAKKRELETLKQDLESGKTELGALADQISASKSELSRLAQDRETAEAELDRLQAEFERQRGAAAGSPAETRTAVQALSATQEATATATVPAADSLAEAKRRFARIDQDGDGRFDRLDFRLKRVSLFGMVDANEDGYLTLDETLLSPEAFQRFDSDGDGKISSSEMADRGSFKVMDTDGDNFVTFEEYVKFLRIGPD